MSIGSPPVSLLKWKRGVLRILFKLTLVYALLCVGGCVFQRRLIYFPAKLDPSSAEQAADREGFLAWRDSSGQVIGWKFPARQSPSASVLVVHGNAGCALDRGYIARPIHDAVPFDVYVLEYPGYGARSGSPRLSSLLAAGEEAFEALPKTLPKYVVSESLGAGVATHVAKTHPTGVDGMLLFAPYNNLASVAQSKMPLLPVRLILVDRYDPAEWLKEYRGPVKIVLAEQDEVIPIKFGRKLFDSYKGPKALQVVPNAEHNDIASQSPGWWRENFLFLQQNGHMSPDQHR
jgi:pimeloyl-ACP methyl ester carboxylesterase